MLLRRALILWRSLQVQKEFAAQSSLLETVTKYIADCLLWVDGGSVRGINRRNSFIKLAIGLGAAHFFDNVPVPDVPIASPAGHSGHFFAPGMYLIPGDGNLATG